MSYLFLMFIFDSVILLLFNNKGFQMNRIVGLTLFVCLLPFFLLSYSRTISGKPIATKQRSFFCSSSSSLSLPFAFTSTLLSSSSSVTSLETRKTMYKKSCLFLSNNYHQPNVCNGKMMRSGTTSFCSNKMRTKGMILPLFSKVDNGEMGGRKNRDDDNRSESEHDDHSEKTKNNNNNNNSRSRKSGQISEDLQLEANDENEENETYPLPSFGSLFSSVNNDHNKNQNNFREHSQNQNHPYFDAQDNNNPMKDFKTPSSSSSIATKMTVSSMNSNSNNNNKINSSLTPPPQQQQQQQQTVITSPQVKKNKSKSMEDDIRGVLKANAAFYRAINEGDVNAFSSVWLEADYIQYFSENQLFSGLEEISENNVNINNLIFGYGEEGSHGLDEDHDSPLFIRVSNTDVHINGLLAWVTCQEHRKGGKQKQKKKENSNLQGLAMLEQYFESNGDDDDDDDEEERFLSEFDDDEDSGIGMNVINSKNNDEKEETFFTTNIFRKFNGKWQMISHHSGSDGIPQNERTISTVQRLEEVLGGENTKISVIPSSALSNGFNNIQGNNFDKNKDNSNDMNSKEDSVEAILDQLKSAIEDKLEERNQAMDSYKDWLPAHQTEIVRTGRYYPDNSGLSMGRNPADNKASSSSSSSSSDKRLNRSNRSGLNNFNNNNDNNNNRNYSNRKRNFNKSSSQQQQQQQLKTLSSTTTLKEHVDSNTNRLTKRTLSAIRRLFTDKRITLSQKRKLIHNVIQCTSIEETSQVELAYELLVENALAGEENAMDEFADQCRIIAEDHRNGSYEADD